MTIVIAISYKFFYLKYAITIIIKIFSYHFITIVIAAPYLKNITNFFFEYI